MSIEWDKIEGKPNKDHKILGQTLLDYRRKISDLESSLQTTSAELNKIKTELEQAKNKIASLEKNIQELKDKIELSKKDQNFSKLLRIGAFIKDDVSELLDSRKKLMINLFSEVSKRLKCKASDLEYLQIREIEEFMLNNRSPKELIKKRKAITVIYYPSDKMKIYEGGDAEKLLSWPIRR